MADKSKIEWTDATWNPIGGCSIASPGCNNCYAQQLAGTRLKTHPLYAGTTTLQKGRPLFNGHLTAAPFESPVWQWPLRWRGAASPRLGAGQPSLIFVGDMSDLFHPDRRLGDIVHVLHVAHHLQAIDVRVKNRTLRPHILQLLTKRPDRMVDVLTQWADVDGEEGFKGVRGPDAVRATHKSGRGQMFAALLDTMGAPPPGCAFPTFDWMHGPLEWPDVFTNIWCGFSAERQQEFDARWPHMRRLAEMGYVVFLSAEPLLGPIDLPADFLALGRRAQVIAGYESGREARAGHPDWARSLRDQCQTAGVPFHFKQWGAFHPADQLANSDQLARHSDMGHALRDGRAVAFDDQWTWRVGTRAAGRLLDGVEHNGYPAA